MNSRNIHVGWFNYKTKIVKNEIFLKLLWACATASQTMFFLIS